MWWLAWTTLPMVTLVMTAGCGGHGLPIVPVRGVVTFDGGACPAPGTVTFTPIEVAEGLPSRPGMASFREDGVFAVTSFREGDGLLPGRYRVTIACDAGLPDPTSPDPWGDVSYVTKGYQPPEMMIAKGSQPLTVTYDVPKKEPRGSQKTGRGL